jgi:hypothetical protein
MQIVPQSRVSFVTWATEVSCRYCGHRKSKTTQRDQSGDECIPMIG